MQLHDRSSLTPPSIERARSEKSVDVDAIIAPRPWTFPKPRTQEGPRAGKQPKQSLRLRNRNWRR